MTNFIEYALTTTKEVKNKRTIQDILTHLMTEVGELAQEIQIAEGKSYKEHGKDGVIGEAIDVIACAIDVISKYDPEINENDLITILTKKLQKWKDTALDLEEDNNEFSEGSQALELLTELSAEMSFDEWRNSEDYKNNIIEPFGDFGYVEAIAYTTYVHAVKNNIKDN
jgi:NTP pyrophosphatase (non-canonical NTP hydrolase)